MTAFAACSCMLACSLRSGSRLWPRRHTFSIAVPVKQPALRLLTNACSAHHQPMTISGSSAASASRIRPPPCPTNSPLAPPLLDYPTDHHGYRCFDLATRCVITSRHVTFDESTFPYRDDAKTYRSLVGALQYLTVTRPDLAFAVQQACLHMHDPQAPHLALLKRTLRYVRGTTTLGLSLHNSPALTVTAYSHTDWVGCPETRRSTSGFCVCSSATPWCLSRRNGNPRSPGLALRLSTGRSRMPRRNAYGSDSSFPW
jgi:hypothetical protein